MNRRFDAIVIGSGFGGAITACRLAEKGMRVLVLERGRRWKTEDYPRTPLDSWIFDPDEPEDQNGWLDMRFFNRMVVAQAAGVGGGSLTYSSVALEANPSVFEKGWPPEITYRELRPYYSKVASMMNLQTIPDGQLTQRFRLAREAAEKLGHSERFMKVPLAVSFSPQWNYDLDEPFDRKHSETFVNAHGQQQGTCIHLGNCDVGCDVKAKNTLDLNYIPRAEKHGAEVRPLHVVRQIHHVDKGYRVTFDKIENGRLIPGEESASRVFLAAGSLGSTELLLRCRDQYRTLPRLSWTLGSNWSSNGNFLSMAPYPDAERVRQSWGPSITSATDFMDGSFRNQRFIVEDDGFPNVLLNALKASLDGRLRTRIGKKLLADIEQHLLGHAPLKNVMVWLGAGADAGDGKFSLRRRWWMPWRKILHLKWNVDPSRALVEAMIEMHRDFTTATEGHYQSPVTWNLFKTLLTLHPLGGCKMGTDADTGVVDHLGNTFGYKHLYVVDGSIVPAPIGRNPSHTIAALAERIADHVH